MGILLNWGKNFGFILHGQYMSCIGSDRPAWAAAEYIDKQYMRKRFAWGILQEHAVRIDILFLIHIVYKVLIEFTSNGKAQAYPYHMHLFRNKARLFPNLWNIVFSISELLGILHVLIGRIIPYIC